MLGPPSSGTSRLVAAARLLSGSIPSCLFFSAYNAEHNHEDTLETLP